MLALATLFLSRPHGVAAAPCDPPVTNPIVCENSKPGNPPSEWEVVADGDQSIQGYAADFSVNKGQTAVFKVKTDAVSYRIDVYRLGYYGGLGARKVATVNPSAGLPQAQPACLTAASVGLVDCGNWGVSASWAVPASAVSGVYIGRLVRLDTGGASHIYFIVRDDSGNSDLLFQTSDTTWQAYNSYGGASLYRDFAFGLPFGRAYKVSYNRPFNTRREIAGLGNRSFFFNAEYPMLRWLEANGFNVSYFSGVDTARRGAEILEHKAFLSVGHDEYWSNEQRASVEAARNAGVNLAFFSGNEVFWKTRWENSIDGANTAWDTLVSYKETHAGAKIDPSPLWTGTWRDPRFSPPADGGRPENGLTGTIFTINGPVSDSLDVPSEYGGLRFWRNTSVATLPAGQVASFEAGILGHEWDEDLDNGARPAGLVHLSYTVRNVATKMTDYGSNYGPGTGRHTLTMYRHSSGALVFGAGTVQWSWALDAVHDGVAFTPDTRIKQATVNLFADMGAQPGSLQPGLVAASKSTDTVAPAATITSPAGGAQIGAPLTVTGTASDGGGGKVAAVEVTTDGGATWHPASGRNSWTYFWAPDTLGPTSLRSRAVDDSGNIGAASPPLSVSVTGASVSFNDLSNPNRPLDGEYPEDTIDWGSGSWYLSGPWELFPTNSVGTTGPASTEASFTFVGSARLLSFEAYNGGTGASQVTVACAANPTASQNLAAGTKVVVETGWAANCSAITLTTSNGWYTNFDNFAYDFGGDLSDQTPPVLSAIASSNVSATKATIGWSTNEAATSQVEYGTMTAYGSTSALNTTLGQSHSVELSGLAPSTLYHYRVKSRDASGNLAVSTDRTVTTNSTPACPCSVWDGTQTPAVAASGDTAAVELGVKLRSDLAGYILGIRFYKGAANTGTHTVNLWSSAGNLIASAPSTNETGSGWQEVRFAAPVAILANTTYVASYHTSSGRYSLNLGYFASAGPVNWPLRLLADGVEGGNGLFRYGPSAFPNQSYSSANYWVDVVYHTAALDTVAPSISARSPAAGASSAGPQTNVTATFDEPVTPSSVVMELRNASGTLLPGSLTYDAASRTATLDPNASLALGAGYTVNVSGARDAAGNTMAPASWSFSTPTCPCSIWPSAATPAVAAVSDTSAWELGVKFRSQIAGYVTGARFYKGAGNTGTHSGSLWAADGTLLATGTFTNETTSGWQSLSFGAPIAIAADTTYVVSYFTSTGRFSWNESYFAAPQLQGALLRPLTSGEDGGNGVYRAGSSGFPNQTYNASNYWVDVIFNTVATDTIPPALAARTPAPSATNVDILTNVTATFTESVVESSISFALSGPSGAVPAAVTYNAATRAATLDPTQALLPSTTYTATVSGARDPGGNTMAPAVWTFQTITCPCSLWSATETPQVASVGDTNPWELGLRFQSQVDGYIRAIRFYKGPANTGTHKVNLWSASGTLLATATSTCETASGWQEVTLAAPVAITAGATYTASYHTSNGGFSMSEWYFSAAARVRSPLIALADASGGNGVYKAGASGFPNQSYHASNYWVDVVFSATP